ncbi:MAG: DUF6650 family protein, partial [Geminicoccaceae bacterium]
MTSITVSATGAGLSWQVVEAERGRARMALQRLESHRLLFNPFELEMPEPAVESAEQIRAFLTEHIAQCESSQLRDPLREIRAAVGQFLTDTQAAFGPQP